MGQNIQCINFKSNIEDDKIINIFKYFFSRISLLMSTELINRYHLNINLRLKIIFL